MLARMQPYLQLMRIDRPIGTLLLLWPTLWALIIASKGSPDLNVLVIFICGVVLMRSAGCVINDFADRHVDGHVKRTHKRPIPSGLVSAKEAFLLFLLLATLSFLLVLTMNALTIKLSFIGIGLAFIYPFMKRYTYLPQLFLALAFSWSIPMAWAAQTNELSTEICILFIINALWTVAYDTLYAMVDRDDDMKIGIKSTAILFGRFDKMVIGILQYAFVALLVGLGKYYQLGISFYVSVIIAACLCVYQQYLIRDRDPVQCFQAFLNNNYVGMVLTVGLFITFW